MITTIVQFRLPQPMTRDEARRAFAGSAPKYRGLAGLIRKHYILSEDGRTAGGIYLWASRADAERLYDDAWRKFVTDKYGAPPQVQWFDSPVTVDNTADAIVES